MSTRLQIRRPRNQRLKPQAARMNRSLRRRRRTSTRIVAASGGRIAAMKRKRTKRQPRPMMRM